MTLSAGFPTSPSATALRTSLPYPSSTPLARAFPAATSRSAPSASSSRMAPSAAGTGAPSPPSASPPDRDGYLRRGLRPYCCLASGPHPSEILAAALVGPERVLADREYVSLTVKPVHRGVHRLAGLRRRPPGAHGAPRALPHDLVDTARVGVHVPRRRPRGRGAAQRPAGHVAGHPFQQVTDAAQPRVVLPGARLRPRPR